MYYICFTDVISEIPLMVHSPDHKPVYWCEKNPKGKLVNFDLEIENMAEPNRELTAFVNGPDKELIHLHLMVTSVFLFAILAAVIIAFLVRNVSPSTKKSLDSRGDHHMINRISSGGVRRVGSRGSSFLVHNSTK